MSFSSNIEQNIKNVDKEHLPKNLIPEIHSHGANHYKNSQQLMLPPMNKFGGQIRSKPQSGFNQASLISGQGQLDFHLNSSGFVEKLLLEMEITVANAAVTIIPHYLIDRIELLSSEGNIISTIYGDVVYTNKIHKTLEEATREREIENLDANYNGVSIPVGQKRIVLHIPTFLDGTQMKLSVIRSKLIARVYFSSLGVTSGLATNITVSLCDIIQHGQQLSGQLEALENQRKMHGIFNYRFLNPVRVASQTIAMVASNYYDIRLTSANSMSAFLLFLVRPNPITSGNVNTFQAIEYFELLDKDNTIVGLKTSNEYHKVLSKSFAGDIFNFKNIYVIPFAISITAANSGSQTGFYSFTSNEIVRIYMPANLVAGSYRVDCYSFDYNKLSLNEGSLSVSK